MELGQPSTSRFVYTLELSCWHSRRLWGAARARAPPNNQTRIFYIIKFFIKKHERKQKQRQEKKIQRKRSQFWMKGAHFFKSCRWLKKGHQKFLRIEGMLCENIFSINFCPPNICDPNFCPPNIYDKSTPLNRFKWNEHEKSMKCSKSLRFL